jgi:hypothetical protein
VRLAAQTRDVCTHHEILTLQLVTPNHKFTNGGLAEANSDAHERRTGCKRLELASSLDEDDSPEFTVPQGRQAECPPEQPHGHGRGPTAPLPQHPCCHPGSVEWEQCPRRKMLHAACVYAAR